MQEAMSRRQYILQINHTLFRFMDVLRAVIHSRFAATIMRREWPSNRGRFLDRYLPAELTRPILSDLYYPEILRRPVRAGSDEANTVLHHWNAAWDAISKPPGRTTPGRLAWSRSSASGNGFRGKMSRDPDLWRYIDRGR